MKRRNTVFEGVTITATVFVAIALWLRVDNSKHSPNPQGSLVATPSPKVEAPEVPQLPPATPFPKATMGSKGKALEQLPAIPAWQHKIDEALQSSANESQTALILVGMFPSLPANGQEQAARHIANLLADGDYDRMKPILLNPKTDKEALDVLYTDLMNRPEATKLHTLLDLAKTPDHPLAEQARDTLGILLGEDQGSNWAKWKSTIDEYMANH